MDNIKNGYKFIKTQDKHTKEVLLSLGYQMVSDDGRTFTFLNDTKLRFEDQNLKKAAYSNKLEM